jgi:hypothetical protein
VFSSSLVQHEVVADYSHLFTVQGSQPDLVPYMLLAHIDVVPASESDGWDAPPFSAKALDWFKTSSLLYDGLCLGDKMQEVNTLFGLSPCILNDVHLYLERSLRRYCLPN